MTARKKKRRRRQRGTGSYRWLGPHRVRLEYRRRSRVKTTEGERDETEARSLLDEFVRTTDANLAVFERGSRMQFNTLADLYLDSLENDTEATTRALYRRNLDQHIRPVIGSALIQELTPLQIQSVLNKAKDASKRKRGSLGRAARANLLVRMRAILNFGVEHEVLMRNVAKSVRMPSRTAVAERPIMTVDYVRALTEAARGTVLEFVVPFAIGTGLRVSEVCGLGWRDLDLGAGTLRVRRAVAVLNGRRIVKSPKTKRSARTDELPAFVVDLLRRHKAAQFEDLKTVVSEFEAKRRQGDGYVFLTKLFEPWSPNEMSRTFSRLIRKKKLPPFRFHDLRHGFATLLFQAGVPMRSISDALGHSSINVTSSIYVHLLVEAKKEKSARLDALLDGAFKTGAAEKKGSKSRP